jgi:hypothetical protein
LFAVGLCTIPLLRFVSHAQEPQEIVVWKVGSPFVGNMPPATIPPNLRALAARFGFRFRIQSFRAAGFASTFQQAVARNTSPDLVAFDNFGIMIGITTPLGRFDGLAGTAGAADLISVSGSLDSLLAPGRGWVYAHRKSRNYAAVTKLALATPECVPGDSWPEAQKALGNVVTNVVTAYLEWDAGRVRSFADHDRLETMIPADRPEGLLTPRAFERAKVGMVRLCGLRGGNRLAVAWTNVSTESRSRLGHTPVLVILRKAASNWKLLVASTDPITNRVFVNDLRARPLLFTAAAGNRNIPAPAGLLSPASMVYPAIPSGERFGSFSWQASQSRDVATQFVEFAYDDDARMFLVDPSRGAPVQRISDGRLWHTNSIWRWRVWSITAGGDVSFSESRQLPH